ncbi:chitin elicitor-binding protein [Canna indica]|uniref:Chitin elicitor-binding protein n=1 Tax=Canna indica TaxID=4628 RepID=A0AAQ3JZU0_9LILI|nr:chitin elicitor-binding protein [Canna indica]
MARVLLLFLCFLLAAAHLLPPAEAARFACRATGGAARCHALVGYTPRNATTLVDVMSLFQVRSFRYLLSANGLPLSTPPSRPVPAGATVRVRFACSCSSGHGASTHRPLYRVGPGDGLDAIARGVFDGLVTYKEIAAANNISDPNAIQVGQELYIPLPCSCDDVGGEAVVHYAHVVASGSSVSAIAEEFGTKEETLMTLNGISDPKSLQAGQVLDVPLRACSSSISNTSMDHGLRVSNGSYILTANNCVLCSCSSSSWQLDCHPTKGISSSVCPAATCGDTPLGNSSSSTVCESTTCTYAGYTNTSSFNILTTLTTQSLCNDAGAPLPQPSDGLSLQSRVQWAYFAAVLSISISMALLGLVL